MEMKSLMESNSTLLPRTSPDSQYKRTEVEVLVKSLKLLNNDDSGSYSLTTTGRIGKVSPFHPLQLSHNGGDNISMSIQEILQLFQHVSAALWDSDVDLRIALLNALTQLPSSPSWCRLESAYQVLIPQLVSCLGDDITAIRREATQCLHLVLKYTSDFTTLLKLLIKSGLDISKDSNSLQKDFCTALNILLTPDLAKNDFHELIHALVKKTVSADKALCNAAQSALLTIKKLIGETQFEEELKTLATPLQKYYSTLCASGSLQSSPSNLTHASLSNTTQRMSREQLIGTQNSQAPHPAQSTPSEKDLLKTSSSSEDILSNASFSDSTARNSSNNDLSDVNDTTPRRENQVSTETYLCGFIPNRILKKLRESHAAKEKYAAIEEFRDLYYTLSDKHRVILGHTPEFLSVCQLLLQESNFNIANVTLDVLCDFVENLHKHLHPYAPTLVHLLIQCLDDNKTMVQQSSMRFAMLLVKYLNSQSVVSQLCQVLCMPGRRTRSKQNVVDIVIAALLTFPSGNFELDELCKLVAPALVERKHSVRIAGLECVALLAHLLGPGRLGPLVVAVDMMEIKSGEEGIMEAVQERISRHQIPRLDSQGLVEYAGNARFLNGGSASSSSAGSTTSSRRAHVTSAASSTTFSGKKSTPASPLTVDTSSPTSLSNTPQTSARGRTSEESLERRRPSAGKVRGRARLPWDNIALTSVNSSDSDYERTLSSRSTMENIAATSKPSGNQAKSSLNSVWLSSGPSETLMTVKDLKALPQKANLKHSKRMYYNSSPHLAGMEHARGTGAGSDPSLGTALHDKNIAATVANNSNSNNNNNATMFQRVHPSNPMKMEESPAVRGSLTKANPLMPITSRKIKDNTEVMEISAADEKMRHVDENRRGSLGILSRTTSHPGKELGKSVAMPFNKHLKGLEEPLRQSLSVPHGIASSDSTMETRKMRRASSNTSQPWSMNDLAFEDLDSASGAFESTNDIHHSSSRRGDLSYDVSTRETDSRRYRSSTSPAPPLPLDSEQASDVDLNSTLSSIRSSASHKRALKVFKDAESKSNAAASTSSSKTSVYQKERRSSQPQQGNQGVSPSQQYNPYSGATFKENPNYEGLVVGRRFSEDVNSEYLGTGDITAANRDKKKSPLKANHALGTNEGAPSRNNDPNDLSTPMNEPNGSEDGFNIIGKGIERTGETVDKKLGPTRRISNPKDTNVSNSKSPTSLTPTLFSRSPGDNSGDYDEMDLGIVVRTLQDNSTQKRKPRQSHPSFSEKDTKEMSGVVEDRDSQTLPKHNSPSQNSVISPSSTVNYASAINHEFSFTKASRSSKNSTILQTDRKETLEPQQGKPPIGPFGNSSMKHLSSPLNSAKSSPMHKWSSVENISPNAMSNPDQLPLEPLPKPEKALTEALNDLSQSDWQRKMCGLNLVQRLCKYHAQEHLAKSTELHTLCLAIVQECKNLRSQVSRMALNTFEMLFTQMGKTMDGELEMCAKVILQKAGESSGFIREDAESALEAMVANTSHQKSLNALIQGGASHKNSAIRRTCAMILSSLCDAMGAGRILSGVKDITDRVLPCAAQFAIDANPETRYYGRKIFYGVLNHVDFEKMCSKHIAANVWRSVKDIVDNLRYKGLGEPPSSTPSANLRRSMSLNRDLSATAAHGSTTASGLMASEENELINSPSNLGETSDTLPRISKSRVKKVKAGGSNIALVRQDQLDLVNSVSTLLSSNDWRERSQGLTELAQMGEDSPDVFTTHLVKIFDKFLPRLTDPNSKVNLQALQVLDQLLPLVSATIPSQLQQILPAMVQKIAVNLSSKNAETCTIAAQLLDSFIEFLECSLLVPALTQACNAANTQTRPILLLKLSSLCERLDGGRRGRLISLHVLPELWRVLQMLNRGGSAMGSGQSLRQATQQLVYVLAISYGVNELLEAAKQQPSNSSKVTQMLEEMIENLSITS